MHDAQRSRKRLLATLGVTGGIMIAEVIGGLLSGSLALLADAGHMLTDLLAIIVAFVALTLSSMPADEKRTYGYKRLEILAALINGVALVVLSVSIFYEAVERWLDPQPIQLATMALVAAVGLAANLVGLWLLHVGHDNLNMRGAFLHVLGDTLSSMGVLIGAGVMALTGWTAIDAVLSAMIGVIIILTSLKLLREVIEVLLEAAPRGVNTEAIRSSIGDVDGVAGVHDLHVWSIAGDMPALSAHVVLTDAVTDADRILAHIQEKLRAVHAIEHSTVQLERGKLDGCTHC